jgi:hypothetical protein
MLIIQLDFYTWPYFITVSYHIQVLYIELNEFILINLMVLTVLDKF